MTVNSYVIIDEAENIFRKLWKNLLKKRISAITLYNEQIGFFRDCERFSEAIDLCDKILEII